jgi:S-disulfanyl-L-cysteine oxidoreductase SoxD
MGGLRFLVIATVLSGWLVAAVGAADTSTPLRSVWSGVFSAEQAARGKARYAVLCGHCHSPSLIGSQAGPPLRGPGFWKKWEGDTLWALFVKIRDYMPEDTIESVTDEEKLDVLTHILVSNNVTAGAAADLPLDRRVLERVVVTADRTTAPSSGNFWPVQVVGCLVRRSTGRWALDQATERIISSDEVAAAESGRDQPEFTAGQLSFTLYNAPTSLTEGRIGQVVVAKGFVFRGPGDRRLSVSSLDVLLSRCPR